jgi:hypothetical protein
LPPQSAHDPDEPGPFAFASDRGSLERAGFVRIEITAHDEQVGSGVLDAMFDIPAIGRLAGSSRPPSMVGDGAVPEAANEREVLAAKTPGIEQGPTACPVNLVEHDRKLAFLQNIVSLALSSRCVDT